MKNKIINPFLTTGYVSPEYFCDREEETKRIIGAINSGRNLTLISLRRVGKTGLLKHVKYHLGQVKNPAEVIYIDLLPTRDANEMLNTLSTALIRIKNDEKNFFEKVLSVLGSLRPKLTYDSLTGQPALEIKVESSSDIQSGLESILHFIAGIKKQIVIMFDEFQQIGLYPEKNIEHIIRTIIQAYPGVSFIFSGSSKHMLENMFLSAGRPFYQSSELMYLENINESSYTGYITRKFSGSGMFIEEPAVEEICRWTRLHTFYVQYVCNLLFETGSEKIDQAAVHRVFHQVLEQFEPLFINYRNLIPGHQFRLVQAIADQDGVMQPTAGAFIKQYNLTSASSVASSLKALNEKEMIILVKEKWFVYDVFFSRWLEYRYRNS